ncbi:MAG: radical SAM protein [Vicinamibacteria bacterium]|nr:radical SAM protein [Vicinamibacteria bacterium]
MIQPGIAAPHLAPRLGCHDVHERHGVRYRDLATKALLNRCPETSRMPFDWTINPYRGCAMGCRYCYAAYTHEYLGADPQNDFHSLIYVKRGGLEDLERRLPALVARGETVALGTATDPYQPGEPALGVTRQVLTRIAAHRGARLAITTKGAAILRDLDLLTHIAGRGHLSIRVSLISTDAALLREVEPWAPPPAVRLEVLRRLRSAGLDAALAVSPVLPALTDAEESLDALLAAARAHGVARVTWNLLFLRSPTREKYLGWLETAFPRYALAYHRAYASGAYLGGAYLDRMRERMARLCAKHGLAAPVDDLDDETGPRPAAQLSLFSSPAPKPSSARKVVKSGAISRISCSTPT